MNATLAEYAARGWSLKPVLAGQKRPTTKGWPDREFGPADFADGLNIAIRLGKHSRDLVDCDVDCEEAIELAPLYLPQTAFIAAGMALGLPLLEAKNTVESALRSANRR